MKDVVLIGDSIRIGYQQQVQRELEEFSRVWGPDQNGRTSRNVLDHLDEWVLSREPDVVHVNAGIHDITRDPDSTTNRVMLEDYSQNVREILTTIQQKTRARLIWATMTPIIERPNNDHDDTPPARRTKDVVAYNEVALELARTLAVEVDDLYAIAMKAGPEDILMPDGVHFTDEGSALLGKAVARLIRG